MKETKEDVIAIFRALHALDVDPIPVNFLNAIDGTKLEDVHELN
jgi:biotin synthase